MKIKPADGGRVGLFLREGAQFAGEGAAIRRVFWAGLDDERGPLPAGLAQTDQRAARDARVGAKNLLAGFGEKRAGRGFDALGFAATEPEPAGGFEIAAVTHAMPDVGAIGDLRRGGGLDRKST